MYEIVLHQAFIMLLLIVLGIACSKWKLLSENGRKELSHLVLNVVNPVVIISSCRITFNKSLLINLLWALLLSVVSYVCMIGISYVIRKKEGRETEIERFSVVYSNCGFMGIPLVSALFGDVGVFYLTAYLLVFNLLVWTHGLLQLTGNFDKKRLAKQLCTPSLGAVVIGMLLFVTQLPLPAVLEEVMTYIGGMNTPLAMIAAGASIAETNLLKAVRKPRVYWIVALRLLVVPMVLLAVLMPFPADPMVKLTVLTASSAPTAVICTLQCLRHGKNAIYAAELFAINTLLSLITLPLVVSIGEFLWC